MNPHSQFKEALEVSEAVANWLRKSYDEDGMSPCDLELTSRNTEITPDGIRITIECAISETRIKVSQIYNGDIKDSVRRLAMEIIKQIQDGETK